MPRHLWLNAHFLFKQTRNFARLGMAIEGSFAKD